MLIALVLGGTLCISLFFVLSAKIMRNGSGADPTFVMGYTHLSAGVLLGLCLLAPISTSFLQAIVSIPFLCLAGAAAVFHVLAKMLHFRALSLTDVAYVSSFAAVSPLLTIFTGWLLLDELPSTQGLLGIVVIVLSILGLHRVFSPRIFRSILGGFPVRDISQNGSLLAFIAAVLPAFGIVFQKRAVQLSDPLTYSTVTMLIAGVSGLTCYFRRIGCFRVRDQLDDRSLLLLFVTGALLALSIIQLSAAITLDIAAHVGAMTRVSIIFQVLLGYFVADQKKELGRRVFWALCIFGGTLLIALSSGTAS